MGALALWPVFTLSWYSGKVLEGCLLDVVLTSSRPERYNHTFFLL